AVLVDIGGNFTVGSTNSLHFGDASHGIDLTGATRTINYVNSPTLFLDGTVSNGGITKAGSGTLTLSLANTFSGGLTLSAGEIDFGNNSAAGTGTLAINGGTVAALTSTKTLTNAVTVGGDFTIAGTQSLVLNGNMDLGGATR